MKPTTLILSLSLSASAFHPLFAAVPLRWTVETSRVAPVVFDAIRGETLALEAAFKSYGSPVQVTNQTAMLYWQTNGMANAWWSTNAVTLAGNTATATFTADMDPGAPSITGFIALKTSQTNQTSQTSQTSYRAAFTLRFRHGPGGAPNVIAQPPPILDLAHTVVINPPWPTEAEFAATTTVMRAELKDYIDAEIEGAGVVSPQTVTNIVDAKIAAIPKDGVSTNAVNAIINRAVETNYLATVAALAAETTRATAAEAYTVKTNEQGMTRINGYKLFDSNGQDYLTVGVNRGEDGLEIRSSSATFELIDYFDGFAIEGIVGWDRVSSVSDGTLQDALDEKADADDLAEKADAATVTQLGTQVTAIGAHLNAEDARFVSTNYDSVARMPEAYVEIKISNQWHTIWREMTRWNAFAGSAFAWEDWGGFHDWSTNVTANLATKAERCWGVYDSETGEYSPDGFTQISSSNVLVAANMSYKRVVSAENAVWVLECNGAHASFGGETNGTFRVRDGDGNLQLEIVKGDMRELGCDAGGITVNPNGTLTIPYSVDAASHPTLRICTALVNADWKSEGETGCPASVSWSGARGAWVATVTPVGAPAAMFVRATYMGGSDTVIHHVAPTRLEYLYIGNKKYRLGTATVGGNTVLTLEEVN